MPDGQVLATHSISAGLDYPGVGPEHSALRDSGRVEYLAATDAEALAAFHELCLLEGIIPALESSHALHVAGATSPRPSPPTTWCSSASAAGATRMSTPCASTTRGERLAVPVTRFDAAFGARHPETSPPG